MQLKDLVPLLQKAKTLGYKLPDEDETLYEFDASNNLLNKKTSRETPKKTNNSETKIPQKSFTPKVARTRKNKKIQIHKTPKNLDLELKEKKNDKAIPNLNLKLSPSEVDCKLKDLLEESQPSNLYYDVQKVISITKYTMSKLSILTKLQLNG